jgi:hypothetical protein
VFVIEAGTGGVDLTNLRDYIADKAPSSPGRFK